VAEKLTPYQQVLHGDSDGIPFFQKVFNYTKHQGQTCFAICEHPSMELSIE
jgi:hypothetical protein